MGSKIIGYAWISNRDTIGVVVTKDDVTGEYKGRISSVLGLNAEADLEHIHSRGAFLNPAAAFLIIDAHGIWPEGKPDTLTTKQDNNEDY